MSIAVRIRPGTLARAIERERIRQLAALLVGTLATLEPRGEAAQRGRRMVDLHDVAQ